MLDYKDIITKHFGLGMSGMAIAKLRTPPIEITSTGEIEQSFRLD